MFSIVWSGSETRERVELTLATTSLNCSYFFGANLCSAVLSAGGTGTLCLQHLSRHSKHGVAVVARRPSCSRPRASSPREPVCGWGVGRARAARMLARLLRSVTQSFKERPYTVSIPLSRHIHELNRESERAIDWPIEWSTTTPSPASYVASR